MKKILIGTFLALASLAVFAQGKFNSLDMTGFGSATFTIGEDVEAITATRYLSPFALNKYETSYELWYEVRVWAEENGYYFENLGQEGSAGVVGREPSSYGKYQPVTRVNWYDSIVWCNALSEKEGLKPCYSFGGKVLKDSGDTISCDLAECDWNANGYRLPTEAEWEYAARKTSRGLQSGSCASGEIGGVKAEQVAWLCDNTDRTHVIGTAGSKSEVPASGKPNGSGIFDMSGNVMEYCWDWFKGYTTVRKGQRAAGPVMGETRVARGAAWSEETMFNYVGDRYAYDPNEAYSYLGFRVAKSVIR